MFEHWRQTTYFDNESSEFPSSELLDDLWLHDKHQRDHVTRAFQGLLQDFNQGLLDSYNYDWFWSKGYERVDSQNATVIFY